MPSFKNWFSQINPKSADANRRFDHWPKAPDPWPVRLPVVETENLMQNRNSSSENSAQFPPALIIGLGPTGESVVKKFAVQLEQENIGAQEHLRAAILTSNSIPTVKSEVLVVRQFIANDQYSTSSRSETDTLAGAREQIHSQFRRIGQFSQVFNFIQNYIQDHRENVRVILVASIAESTIGLIGDILQLLQIVKGDYRTPYLTISAFISLTGLSELIDPAESYAALRELGRFATAGRQIMPGFPGISAGGVTDALLDHIFLVEPITGDPVNLKQRMVFKRGEPVEGIVETLFTILQPACNTIWQNLVNSTNQSANMRFKSRSSLISTIGISSLQVPTAEIWQYLAARLAFAVIFGERFGHPNEGLVNHSKSKSERPLNGKLIATRWLIASNPGHPIFEWLLQADGPSYFQYIPEVSEAFTPLFQSQISNGLASTLNDQSEVGQIDIALAGIHWIYEHLSQIQTWCAKIKPGNSYNQLMFQELISQWINTTKYISTQIASWQAALIIEDEPVRINDGWKKLDSEMSDLGEDWRKIGDNSKTEDWRTVAQASASNQAGKVLAEGKPLSIYELCREQISWASQTLSLLDAGFFRLVVTGWSGNSIAEADAFYLDTVRPELQRRELENSRAFRQIRDRLGWWVNLIQGGQPQVLLYVLPGDGEGVYTHPQLFSSDQRGDFVEAVTRLAYTQVQGIRVDLSSQWLEERLNQLQNHLALGAQPMLSFDLDRASEITGRNEPSYYMVGPNKILTGRYVNSAFDNVSPNQRNELGEGAESRLTAMSFWHNIPFRAVLSLEQFYKEYKHQPQLHLYAQERNAAFYERQIFYIDQIWQELPPELTLAMTDIKLISIFCQSLITGVIWRASDEYQQKNYWQVRQVGEFETVDLADARNNEGIYLAFRCFNLELPFEQSRHQLNPNKPFYSLNKEKYLRLIVEEVRKEKHNSEYQQQRDRFKLEILDQLSQTGRNDKLIQSLIAIFRVEFYQPQWDGWW